MRTRAAVFTGVGEPLVVEELELDEPGPGDVVVRMRAVGICGSDLHVVRGEWPRATPMVLGHEGAGEVAAIGADVRHVAPGDRVVVSWNPACGSCAACAAGRPTACLPLRAGIAAGTLPDGRTGLHRPDGSPVYRMATVAALAEHVLMPARAVLPLGPDVPFDQAALLGCAALTGVGAATTAGIPPGGVVAIVGAGGVGQFVVQGARLAGAATIVAADPSVERLALARRVGATHTCSPDELVAIAAEHGTGGADVAFDCVGSAQTAALALAAARPAGRAVLVGMPPAGQRLDLDPAEFTNREKTLTGSVYGSGDPADALPALLGHVAAGRVELAPLLGPAYPLERVEEAVQVALAGRSGRVVVAL